ncbi:hypothetical protein VE00_10076 [Pseudogymnoascus sp. WSF 3629]|nr:hypothetical protein VE00_10076 [Pseudogymnoascus sp. WSF 3629]
MDYVSALGPNLLFGSRIVLYDGSPFTPDAESLIRLAEQERTTHLGISPRYLHELQSRHIKPRDIANLSELKIVTSTGMVLSDALFNWFYDEGFPANVQLSNISGGTEIAGCFGIANSLSPIYVGGCAGRSLGIPLSIFDANFEGGKGAPGVPVKDGVPGELVATAAFPNMPVAFWGPDGKQRYHDTYFARFDNVWAHGDFALIHPITKQLIFLGRTDGVLNPSGVRFGSADIYRVIESKFSAEIKDSLCVGQKRDGDSDERVMLFLLMKPGIPFTPSIVEGVKACIRADLSPRHVPTFIFQTQEIPVTVNLKKVELPVKKIVSGYKVEPSGTLLNPASLEYYYQFAQPEILHVPKNKI